MKVTRNPYQACPYRWSLSVADISVGEGTVSEAACADLSGDFNLDFKACSSTGDKLVWEGDCEVGGDEDNECGTYLMTVDGISGFDCADTYNGAFVMRPRREDWLSIPTCVFRSQPTASLFVTDASIDCTCSDALGTAESAPAWYFVASYVEPHLFPNHSGLTLDPLKSIFDFAPAYYSRPGGDLGSPATITFTLERVNCGSGWPATIIATKVTGSTGPKPTDRIRSKWHLEYSITDAEWTLRSFNRLQYPIYKLSDSTPCEGDEKVLSLVVHENDEVNGCGIAPRVVTITRECNPTGTAPARKRSKMNGQIKHNCGCDCQDQPTDNRDNQCTSIATVGCETWDADQIECKFPASSDCCTYCEEDTAPCAWEALFDCDIKHNDIPIAAAVVTLRHECYFSDEPCQWVAVGPSPNAADGGTGAQPVCATCADTCLTGCSWSSWQTAACPKSDCDCGLAFCPDAPSVTAITGTFPGLAETEIQLNRADSDSVIFPRCRVYVTFLGGIDNNDGFTTYNALYADLQLSERCLELRLEYYDSAATPQTKYATYTATVPDPVACPSSITFSKPHSNDVFPDTVEITVP